ncbi:hypothetical protein GN244_ATG01581 [Phytophthora infestans]|uniref:Uncharacterized protein n=1 Tax=Phytophthora infestans TaxID=4787 RepID=A0A833T1X5_PHYIN|nr:hypothetical protein GN244_ATG01581 [Phytophthora infestans]
MTGVVCYRRVDTVDSSPDHTIVAARELDTIHTVLPLHQQCDTCPKTVVGGLYRLWGLHGAEWVIADARRSDFSDRHGTKKPDQTFLVDNPSEVAQSPSAPSARAQTEISVELRATESRIQAVHRELLTTGGESATVLHQELTHPDVGRGRPAPTRKISPIPGEKSF